MLCSKSLIAEKFLTKNRISMAVLSLESHSVPIEPCTICPLVGGRDLSCPLCCGRLEVNHLMCLVE
jgi:hypothetical protein